MREKNKELGRRDFMKKGAQATAAAAAVRQMPPEHGRVLEPVHDLPLYDHQEDPTHPPTTPASAFPTTIPSGGKRSTPRSTGKPRHFAPTATTNHSTVGKKGTSLIIVRLSWPRRVVASWQLSFPANISDVPFSAAFLPPPNSGPLRWPSSTPIASCIA